MFSDLGLFLLCLYAFMIWRLIWFADSLCSFRLCMLLIEHAIKDSS